MKTRQEMADALCDAIERGDAYHIVLAENDIAASIDIPLDETELGLTSHAYALIDDFVKENGSRV